MSIKDSNQATATPECITLPTLPMAEPCTTNVQHSSRPPPPSATVSVSPAWRRRWAQLPILAPRWMLISTDANGPLISWRSLTVGLTHLLYCLLTIKIHVFCYLGLRHQADHALPAPSNADRVNDITAAALSASRTWTSKVRVVTRFWKLSRISSAIFLPASIALLQIPPVFNNLTSRSFATLAFISAVTGLVLSCIYLNLRSKIESPQVAERWVEASAGDMRHTLRSIEFWAALALPISSTVWCLLWFMLTMFVLAWGHSNEDEPHHSMAGVVMSGLSASLLAVGGGVQLWRALNALVLVGEG